MVSPSVGTRQAEGHPGRSDSRSKWMLSILAHRQGEEGSQSGGRGAQSRARPAPGGCRSGELGLHPVGRGHGNEDQHVSVSCGVSVPGSGICTGGRPIQANGTTGCRRSTRPGPEPTPATGTRRDAAFSLPLQNPSRTEKTDGQVRPVG